MRSVQAHPALQGSPKGNDLAPAIHSSHEDLVAPYNDHDRFNHGEFVNHKRRRESQQAPPQLLDLDLNLPPLGKRNSSDFINHHSTLFIN